MSESFAELLEESLAGQQTTPGSIIVGTVIDVNNDVVIVNAGLKSEAVIPASQFLNDDGEVEVDVGDEVRRERMGTLPPPPQGEHLPGDGKPAPRNRTRGRHRSRRFGHRGRAQECGKPPPWLSPGKLP